MGKLLRVGDYILLSAAIAGEVFDTVRLAGGIAPELMKQTYGFVPPNYKKGSYLSTVSRLLKTGDIRKIVDKEGTVHLQLTSAGNTKFKRKFPILSLKRKKWDGYMMILVFDIPETERRDREKLRNKLIELGFGMLQESVWMSPFHFEEDLRELLVATGLKEKAFILEAKKIHAGDFKTIVRKVWKLDEIDRNYQFVTKMVGDYLSSEFKSDTAENMKKEIWELYLETIKKDPFLPEELLEISGLRDDAMDSIAKLK
jgi:DNA-binding transcriptional regulator PaaX